MKINVVISPTESTAKEFAKVDLLIPGRDTSRLEIDFTKLLRCTPKPTSEAIDFLFFTAIVYGIDKLVPRKLAKDRWTRTLEVAIPVLEPKKWRKLSSIINDCVSFLTGDTWSITFLQRKHSIIRRKRHRRPPPKHQIVRGEAACLFSGGLDSLVGVIDWLELHAGKSLVVVGHHDPSVAGPLSDQKRVLDHLKKHYRNRISSVLIGIGQCPSGPEITFRSRSLLFIGLGIWVASGLGEATPLLIPENGTIAINVELTPSRRGSCSTRTAHPYYLSQLQRILDGLNLTHPLVNPHLPKTKGEVIQECRNATLLQRAGSDTVSCAKRGHKRTWINRQAKGCGRCMPCIYRRAALHRIGIDQETYGVNICKGDVDVSDKTSVAADDFRALLSFLNRNLTKSEIARMIVTNGPLVLDDAIAHAATVDRAMNEIRSLLAEKGTPKVRRLVTVMKRNKS